MSEETKTLVEEMGQIREAVKGYEEVFERGEALKRLEANPDFIKLIMDDYMRDEVVRNLSISHDAALDPSQRKDAETAAHGGVLLRRYFIAIHGMAQGAKNYIDAAASEIAEIEAEIDEITAEAKA